MAQECRLSVLHASEEVHDFNCSPCLDEGIHNEALKYCVSCKRYYCKKCLDDHNKFPALISHRVQDVASLKESPTSQVGIKVEAAPLALLCEHHPDEIIKMYCGKHEVVCCTVCIAVGHRDCEGVDYIPKIAKDIRSSKEFKDFVGNIEVLKEQYQETKEEIQEEIQKITDISEDVIKDIRCFKKEIIAKLDELENKSIERVNERCKKLREKMNMTVSKVVKFLEQLEGTLKGIDNESEATLFARMNRAKRHEMVKDDIDTDINEFEGFSLHLDKSIFHTLNETNSLVKADIPLQAVVKRKYKVMFKGDKEPCSITDICVLDDGTIVMTDAHNKSLKRFDKSFGKIEKVYPDGTPFGICKCSSSGEFIITLCDGQEATFVSCTDKKMILKKSFKVGAPCRGICLIEDSFFVSCGGGTQDTVPGHIRKFDLSGNMLCSIETDDSGNRLFALPRHLTVNDKKTKIYVADGINGVVVLDKAGQKIGQYKHVNLKGAFCVSCTKHGNFVSVYNSNNIQHFDDNYRFIGTLLNQSKGLQKSGALGFIESKTQMILSMDLSNEVLLIQFKREEQGGNSVVIGQL